ncbi:MAG: AAA family ATPase, partial [Cyanobacteria bacterium]|nr:AAA family ATPase [Cyanobacteriota bacterium]
MQSILGYRILEQLHTGRRTQVYRAKSKDDQPVVLKVLRHQQSDLDEVTHFWNQYAVSRTLNHPAITRPLVLEHGCNEYVLVMPDEGLISLPAYLQQQQINVSTVLAIALQLAEALHYLSEHRTIHKDIKPSNILIHPETGKIQLIDFSISSLLPKESKQLANPNVLEGTLAYISPEQSGRANRDIDYRTDFYSLGVTLFELLVGELPFPTTDPMGLIHCHMAQPVRFPDAAQISIPAMVQAIVCKLMAKNAEERYQSALGLKHDLERCLQQLETTGAIEPFELGERDISNRFLIPEKLYGREKEIQSLLDAFARVASGTSEAHPKTEMLLLTGFSGIGKTAVINEVLKPITQQKGYFIKGKFDQFNCNAPFSAFVQAFRSLVEQLLGESDTDLAAWKTKILSAVGASGQVIIEVIPELELIIGKQPEVPDLSGSAAQNRFDLLFTKFVQVFTARKHPLVLFLDDLQWADATSLKLLKLLMTQASAKPGAGHLLLLGAYRNNEVFPAHPLMLTLHDIEKQSTS